MQSEVGQVKIVGYTCLQTSLKAPHWQLTSQSLPAAEQLPTTAALWALQRVLQSGLGPAALSLHARHAGTISASSVLHLIVLHCMKIK